MIIEKFEKQVERTPGKLAVKTGEQALTYRGLNAKANQVAHEIIRVGHSASGGNAAVVSLLFQHGAGVMAAIIAALKAQKTYVILDVNYPQKRLSYIQEHSQASVILTDTVNQPLAERLAAPPGKNIKIINIDNIGSETPGHNIKRDASASRPAYILYTSGSTGKPKGVVQTHAAVLYFIRHWSQRYSLTGSDRISLLASLSHDAAVPDIYGALLNGAALFPFDIKRTGFSDIKDFLVRERITIWHSVPTLYRYFTRHLNREDRFPYLRLLVLGGEEITEYDVSVFQSLFPRAEFSNIYGQTESTVNSIWLISGQDQVKRIGIGEPIGETEILLVDENGGVVEEMGVGEIVIASEHVALEYWQDKENSEKVFTSDEELGRLYWTGDLGRLHSDGNICFSGRKDFQIKIRGFRVETGEIESMLLTHPAVKEAAVIAGKDENTENYLCAYFIADESLTSRELMDFLSAELPDYMVPGYFIEVDRMPLTASGKIDRNALPASKTGMKLPGEYEAPGNRIERQLLVIWQDVLGVENPGINSNFFELGGHSLLMMTLAAKIHQAFNVELQVIDIFDYPTIKELARCIMESEKTLFFRIEPAEEKEYCEATLEQKRLFFLHKFEEMSIAYNIPCVLGIEGEPDRDRFQDIFASLVKRHKSLRISFELRNEKPIQRLRKEVEFHMRYRDEGKKGIESDEDIKNIIKDFIRPFDLKEAPLLRVELVRLLEKSYLLLLDIHHIIADGVSINILIEEFGRLYDSEELPGLRIDYKDYSLWQSDWLHSTQIKQQEAYWLSEFQDEIPVLDLPLDYPRPTIQSFEGDVIFFNLEEKISRGLKQLARETGTTLNMLFLAGYYILLHKYSSQEDIIIGSITAGRYHVDMEHLVGLFVKTFALRNYPAARKTFIRFLLEVKENTLKAFENQLYPFGQLVEKLHIKRDSGRTPLFDAVFALQTIDLTLSNGPVIHKNDSLKLTPYTLETPTSMFDLCLMVHESDNGIVCWFRYCTKLFKKETIEQMRERYVTLLEGIVDNKEKPITDLEILNFEEKNRLLYDFNNTESGYPKDKTLYRLFAEQAGKVPDHIALVGRFQIPNPKPHTGFDQRDLGWQPVSITYRELNRVSYQLAGILREKGTRADTIVGLMVERSVEMIVGILGILMAGGAYLPIAPDYPPERIDYMLKDSQANLLLAAPGTRVEGKVEVRENCRQPQGLSLQILIINDLASPIPSTSRLDTTNLAYVIYTSGSTGKPKGTFTLHYNVIRVVKNTNYIEIAGSDRVLQLSNYAFDGSVFDIFAALLNGAVLVMIEKEKVLMLEELAAVLKDEKISVFFLTTALFNALVDLKIESLENSRKVLFGGELVSVEHVKKACHYLGEGRIIHMYGPTETTVYATYYPIDRCGEGPGTIPIGKPLANTTVFILDKSLKLVPIGVPGEIYIGGDGLARGYLNRPELTCDKFDHDFWDYRDYHDKKRLRGVRRQKLYRTGDLGRWLPDGNIEFSGRIDHQVKIRGFRVEPGEIESQLLKHKKVKEVVVIMGGETEDNYLCAYFTGETGLLATDLREYLSGKLPGYMIPAYFISLEELPLTANGKINRVALPKPGAMGAGVNGEYTAPTNPLEKKLAEIWQEVLHLERVGITDNFFEKGGHSLKALLLISTINKQLEVNVSIKEIFKAPTIKKLALYIKNKGKYAYIPIEHLEQKEYYLLSSAQKRLFFLRCIDEASTNYNMPWVLKIKGELIIERLEETCKKLIARHESLRTSFARVDDEPVQRIQAHVEFAPGYRDSDREAERRGGRVEIEPAGIIKDFLRPFDLSHAPLLRVELIKTGVQEHILMLDMHHIISDGTSMSIFINEFMVLYAGETLPAIQIRYKDFSEWQNKMLKSGEIKKQEAYWLKIHKGETTHLDLPCDYPRPALKDFEGDRLRFELDTRETNALNRLALEEGGTLYILLLSLVNILLCKLSGQEVIVVGTAIAGRRHPDLHQLIGMFVNTLALRNNPNGYTPFKGFLQQVKENTLEALENQDYQFEELVEKVVAKRDLSRNPLFDVMLVLENMEVPEGIVSQIRKSALQINPYPYENRISKFDLSFNVAEAEKNLLFSVEYSVKLFKKDTIKRFIGYFKKIVSGVLKNNHIKIAEIEIISGPEKKTLLDDFNNTAAEYPRDRTIPRLFREQVEKTPDHIALVGQLLSASGGNISIAYRELHERSNQLARHLLEKGLQPGTIVAIMLERSIEMIIGIIAILKAGGAYLPIDPGYPRQRVNYMLQDSGPGLLITTADLSAGLWPGKEILFLLIDHSLESDAVNRVPKRLVTRHDPQNPAYVIYTSGTTGKPGGVVVTHQNVVRLMVNDRFFFDFSSTDIWTMFHSFCFDFSVWEMYGALLYGGQLVVIPKMAARDSRTYLRILKEKQVTVVNQTPSAFYNLADLELQEPQKELTIRYVIFGGEALNPVRLKKWNTKYPDTKLINMYGITETTVHVTFKEITASEIESQRSNIGKPIPTLTIYIMDKYLKLQPHGAAGELYVGGDGVSRGYLNNPGLTAERFLSLFYRTYKSYKSYTSKRIYKTGDLARFLAQGDLEYLGRIDFQVKIRGFRIELGDIRSQLLKHPQIKETVVVCHGGGYDGDNDVSKYLCAYIVPKSTDNTAIDRTPTVSQLKEYLSRMLPHYMIPAQFLLLEQLPLTANGKVDRRALAEPVIIERGDRFTAPRNRVEEQLVEIWSDVLGIEPTRISIDADFFELGGHSLRATTVGAKLHKTFHVLVPLEEIFRKPTIREISDFIRGAVTAPYVPIQSVEKKEYYPLSSAQKQMYLRQQLDLENTGYNIVFTVILEGDPGKRKLTTVFREMVERHEPLRTSFVLIDGEPMQRIHGSAAFEIEFLIAGDTGGRGEELPVVTSFIRPFDLARAPLLRVGLIKRGVTRHQEHILIVDMHHIITDINSAELFLKEFSRLYDGETLAPPRVQYKDYVLGQAPGKAKAPLNRQQAYWLQQFPGEKGNIPLLELNPKIKRPLLKTFKGEQSSLKIGEEDTNALKMLALEEDVTLFMLFLAIFYVLLAKISGQEDIVIGSPIAGRKHEDLQPLLGIFVNMLALRNFPEEEKTVVEFLREVKERTLTAFENQDFQYEDLVEQVVDKRYPGRNPLFDVVFVMRNVETAEMPLPGLKLKPYKMTHKKSVFDMTLIAVEKDREISIILHYSDWLFNESEALEFLQNYIEVLKQTAKNKHLRLKEITLGHDLLAAESTIPEDLQGDFGF